MAKKLDNKKSTTKKENIKPVPVEPTNDVVEPANDVVEPANDVVEPTNDVVEPANDVVEPTNDVVDPVDGHEKTIKALLKENASLTDANNNIKKQLNDVEEDKTKLLLQLNELKEHTCTEEKSTNKKHMNTPLYKKGDSVFYRKAHFNLELKVIALTGATIEGEPLYRLNASNRPITERYVLESDIEHSNLLKR